MIFYGRVGWFGHARAVAMVAVVARAVRRARVAGGPARVAAPLGFDRFFAFVAPSSVSFLISVLMAVLS